MFLAPRKVNQEWQNRGVEGYVRNLAQRAGTVGGFVRLSATATSYGSEVSRSVGKHGERFLKSVEYRIELHMPGQPVRRGTVKLNVPRPPVSYAYLARRSVHEFVDVPRGRATSCTSCRDR